MTDWPIYLSGIESSCEDLERDRTAVSSGGNEMTCKNCLNEIILEAVGR